MRPHGDDGRVGASRAGRIGEAYVSASMTRRRDDKATACPRARSQSAACSGNAAARPLRATTICAALAAPPNDSRSTFRKTCADARDRRRIERGEAKGRPQVVAHARRQWREQCRRRSRRRRTETPRVAAAREPADRRDALAPREAARAQQRRRAGRAAREGCARAASARCAAAAENGRIASGAVIHGDATLPAGRCRDAQRLGIGAEQQVLAVVERQAVANRRARARPPSARAASCSSTRHAVPRELDRRRASGPAAADDGDHARQRRARRDPELAQRRERDAPVEHAGSRRARSRRAACGRSPPSTRPGALRAPVARRQLRERARRTSVRARSTWNAISARECRRALRARGCPRGDAEARELVLRQVDAVRAARPRRRRG